MLITPWIRCGMCEDYICAIHATAHAHECDCPPIETWVEYGLDPYGENKLADVLAMLEATKGWEEEAA
jgi:hypothetical protein